jgi:NAD(P)-dependent dehydrogenase (short-subunit alcohol dehydrogenase family)
VVAGSASPDRVVGQAGLQPRERPPGLRADVRRQRRAATIALQHPGADVAGQLPTDVADPAAVERMVAGAVDGLGGLDLAVNNAAGGGHWPTPLAEVRPDQFRSALAISLEGVFLSLRHEIPAMLAQGAGSIVNMASTAGLEAVGGLAGYVSATHGVIGLTKVAAATVWLCSDQASYITGATLTIDGGKLAGTPPFSASGGGSA